MSYDRDDGRVPVTELRRSRHVARKAHLCSAGCPAGIRPGDRYETVVALVDGDFYQQRTCGRCDDATWYDAHHDADWKRQLAEDDDNCRAAG